MTNREASRKYAKSKKGKATRKKYRQTETYKKVQKRYQDRSEQLKRYYQDNKENLKCKDLQKKYGITLEEYNNFLEQQNYLCNICENHIEEFSRSLAVDHCHKTGKVRSLLCSKCNTALGLVGENIDVLESMIGYIKEHS